ncbi:alpha/beta hydrolase [Novosphingobium ovatum]|uniref:hypothetical protein n=1 Tax=Novosphingobium ovatum TaxID=1908523 RepID=UPI001D10748F|nr:hypothetical protein [Novosphingobium ovatum]
MAQAPAAEETPPADMAAQVAAARAALDAGGQGAFKAEMVSDPRLPTHTIYRPRNMAAATRAGRLPIVAFGNGACANIGNRFRYFLTEVASHGYLVLATGPARERTVEWKVSLTPPGAPVPMDRPPESFAAQLNDAIDWAIAENSRKGSPYFGKLDPSKVAVMGQSCGGVQAVSAAADKRVKTALVLNSGTFAEGSKPLPGTGDANKASLRRIHVPVAWISGDPSDVAHKNAMADFAAFTHAPAMWAWHEGTGHSAHWRDPHGGLFTPVVVDWLDWQLKRKSAARATFTGVKCKLCAAPGWHVQGRGL